MIAAIVWERPQLLWLTVLLLALSATAWLLFDRYTTRSLRTRLRCGLFVCRMAALALISLSLLRPTISLREASAHRGVVAVLVDQSASMSVIDASRPRAEFVALAAALGDIDGKRRDAKLIAVADALRAIEPAANELTRIVGELDYAHLTQRSIEAPTSRVREAQQQLNSRLAAAVSLAGQLPAAAPFVATLKAVNVSTATTRPDSLTSTLRSAADACRALLLDSDARLDRSDPNVHRAVSQLTSRTRLELIQRCLQAAVPRISEHFTARVLGFGQSLGNETNLNGLAAVQSGTDLFAALRELRHRLAGERLSAVIVCSDGHQTEPAAGESINTSDLPIYAINPAAENTADLAIQQLALPRSIMVAEPAIATATLSNLPPRLIATYLTLSGGIPARQFPVNFSEPTTRVAVPFTAEAPGPLALDALVDAEPGEATLQNNALRSWTRVATQPLRIALLCSGETANTRSLEASLADDSAVTLSVPPLDAEADLSDTVLNQDLVVLSDLPYASLSEGSWQAIQKFVRERGGAVLIVSASPAIYVDYARHESTAPLLAWTTDQTPTLRLWPGASPTFRPIAANAEAVASMPFSDEAESNRQLWRDLPALFHVLNFPSLIATAQPLMVEAQTRNPLLVTQPLGVGHVALLGSDEFYRWNTGRWSPQLVWRRLIEQLAGGAYAVDDGVLSLDADSLAPQPGQTLRVRARVRAGSRIESDELFDPPLLIVERDGRRYFSQLMAAPSDSFAIRSEVSLPNLSAGFYRLTLLWADRKVTLSVQVAETYTRELSDVAGDSNTLATLAGPRGAVLPLEDLPGLAARIEAATDPTPAIVSYGLWDSPYLFLLIVGCFGIDWSIRQHAGLA